MISLTEFVTNSFMFYSLPLNHLELKFHLKESYGNQWLLEDRDIIYPV